MIRLAVLALALSGCAPVESQTPVGVVQRICDVSALGDLVGKAGTSELGVEALRRSKSGTVRWIRPGMAVTMDFRQDRLDIVLDAKNLVTEFKCG